MEFAGDWERLSIWLKQEYKDADASRRGYEASLDEQDRQYEARPKVAKKTFPWIGASNLEVPVGATHVDTVESRMESVYFGTQPLVSIRPKGTDKWQKHCEALQDYMEEVSLPASRYRDEKAAVLLTTAKLGTGYQLLLYDRMQKQIRLEDNTVVRSTIHEGPRYQSIHPKNLIFPFDARNIEMARWISIREFMTWNAIISEAANFNYPLSRVEMLESHGYTTQPDTRRERRMGLSPSGAPRVWEMVRTYAYYQDDNMEFPEDIWIRWAYPSGIILEAIYNPYEHMQRPITKTVYMLREDAFTGIGIMTMLQMIQAEITDIHNYCLDNILAGNTIVAVGRKDSVESLKIHPMAFIQTLNDPKDFHFERIGTALSGHQIGEAAANAYAERRTGVGDSNIPRMSSFAGAANNRMPATTTLALIGEGNKRFELAIGNSKRSDDYALMQHVILVRQYWSALRRNAELWNAEKANLITDLFTQETEAFVNNLLISVNASTTALNEQAEQQKMLVIADFMQQFYSLFVTFVQLLTQAPQYEEQIRTMINGISEFAKRLLRTFDIQEPERFIPKLDTPAANAVDPAQAQRDQLVSMLLGGAVGGGAAGTNGNAGR